MTITGSTYQALTAPGGVLLISCYELGHQPVNLASPLAQLGAAGYDPVAVDSRGRLRANPELRQPARTLDDKTKAVSFAAYAALVDLFPGQQDAFAAQIRQLGYAIDGSDRSTAAGVGAAAAQAWGEQATG